MSVREREKIQEVLRGISEGDVPVLNEKNVKVAGIQFSTSPDISNNIKKSLDFVRVALDKGAQLICFSELFSLPWFSSDDLTYRNYAEPIPGPSTEPFIALSEKYDSVFFCPVYEKTRDNYFNSIVMVANGCIKPVYRKLHIPNIPYWEERTFFDGGDLGLPVIQTPYAQCGFQICWDNFYPESSRILALKGAQIIFAPTAAAFDSHFRWESIISASAIVNNVFAFRINRVGTEGFLHFYGKSFCVDPFGEFVSKPSFDRDAIMIADINLSAIETARKEFPFLKERRIDIYQDILNDSKI